MSYKRSKYFITRGGKKIKYLLSEKNSEITVVFFHGFMSAMIGKKPKAIQKFTQSIEDADHLSFVQGGGHGGSHPHKGKRYALPNARLLWFRFQ